MEKKSFNITVKSMKTNLIFGETRIEVLVKFRTMKKIICKECGYEQDIIEN